MYNPLLSVIMPVHNSEQFLPDAVNCLLAQSYRNLEIILVDDGSTDSSGAICDAFSNKYPNIRTFHIHNSGVSSARNFGLKKSRGDYIGFIDSDDMVNPRIYESLVDASNEGRNDIVQCGVYVIDKKRTRAAFDKMDAILTRKGAIRGLFEPRKSISNSVWNKIYKREIVVGLAFDPKLSIGEDLKFNVQAFLRANSISVISSCLYKYFLRDFSAMNSTFSQRRFDDFKLNDWLLGEFAKNGVMTKLINTRDAKLCVELMYLAIKDDAPCGLRNVILERARSHKKRYWLGFRHEIALFCMRHNIGLFEKFVKSKK